VSEARERLAELLGRVEYGHELVTICKRGKPVAVLVTMEDYAFMESAEDAYWVKELAKIEAEPGYDPNDTVPHDRVWADLRKVDAAEWGGTRLSMNPARGKTCAPSGTGG
jgi:prevent-host-death family protein